MPRPCSPGSSKTSTTHRRSSGPSLTGGCDVRSAPAVLRPPPTPTRRNVHFPASTGYRTRISGDKHAGHRAGEGLPSSRRHYLNVPRPIRRRVLGGCVQVLHRVHGLHRDYSGSAPSAPTLTGRTSNDAAGFASCCGPSSCSPKRAFDTGLRPGPFPTRAASLLPGLLTATRTGLTPASDDEHEQNGHPVTRHLQFHWAHGKSRLSHLDDRTPAGITFPPLRPPSSEDQLPMLGRIR